jgi:hypothetical protein
MEARPPIFKEKGTQIYGYFNLLYKGIEICGYDGLQLSHRRGLFMWPVKVGPVCSSLVRFHLFILLSKWLVER